MYLICICYTYTSTDGKYASSKKYWAIIFFLNDNIILQYRTIIYFIIIIIMEKNHAKIFNIKRKLQLYIVVNMRLLGVLVK